MRRISSTPSSRGIIQSVTTRGKSPASKRRQAASPSAAVVTWWPHLVKKLSSRRRVTGSSSAINTFMPPVLGTSGATLLVRVKLGRRPRNPKARVGPASRAGHWRLVPLGSWDLPCATDLADTPLGGEYSGGDCPATPTLVS